VRAAGRPVLLDCRDAVLGRAGDRLALSRISSVTASAAASRPPLSIASAIGDDLLLRELGELEQRVGGALDVLDLVREVHAGDLPRPLPALVAVVRMDGRDDGAPEIEFGRVAAAFRAPAAMLDCEYSTNAGVVIEAVRRPSASSPAYCCIRGPVPAT
jgi:hypothetical protein